MVYERLSFSLHGYDIADIHFWGCGFLVFGCGFLVFGCGLLFFLLWVIGRLLWVFGCGFCGLSASNVADIGAWRVSFFGYDASCR